MEQKILQCVTCRKDKFDLTENFISVGIDYACVHEGVSMCVYSTGSG